ncbi:hypothetical protein [Tenacibaculum ovolyticum]|uniref:hypothetical protein n=1 Tax=Tenacibaculum ovolyticum TaxID=104270 RepID=UPI0012DF7937|nr:hypothetical protein [Tenacibaculum ovolyticum]
MEESINTLLLVYLGIDDKSKTKNFGNKAGISFKSKIDLLYDINVLSPEERLNIELQMNFRNKFLHDINCDTFVVTLQHFDNGIKNRFFKFLDNKEASQDENSYRKAYQKLFENNTKVTEKKFKEKRGQIIKNGEVINSLIGISKRLFILSNKPIQEVILVLDKSDLEKPKQDDTLIKIRKICEDYPNKVHSDSELKIFKDIVGDAINNKINLKNLLS